MRQTIEIDRNSIARSVDAARDNAAPELEIGDTRARGLSLRFRPLRDDVAPSKHPAVWTLRGRIHGKQTTYRIGEYPRISTTYARDLALYAKSLMKAGNDPRPHIAAAIAGEEYRAAPDPNEWTFGRMRDAFLNHVEHHNRPATHQDYRLALTSPHVRETIEDETLVSELTRTALSAPRDRALAHSRRSFAHKVARVINAMMSFAEDSSLIPADTLPRVKAPGAPETKTRTSTIEDAKNALAAILNDKESAATTRFAATLCVLTCQRIETVVSARREHFDGDSWNIPPASMKRNEAHAIPMPSTAVEVVREALRVHNYSYLFPRLNVRRNIVPGTDDHVSSSAVRSLIRRASGGYTPHDFRRTLRTFGREELGLREDDIERVLAHSFGKTGVRGAYDKSQYIAEKRAVLEAWENAITG